MTPLPEQYRKNSYDFKLVERNGDVAIYEQREPLDNRFLCYEVFIVQKQKASVLPNGMQIHEKEVSPSASQWGTLGYSCWTLDAAKEKAVILSEKISRIALNSSLDV